MVEMLRPMSTGELMDRTLVLYRRNFRLFAGIASLGAICYLLFQLLTTGSALLRAGTANRVSPFAAASVGFGFVAGFIVMLAGVAIAHAATVKAVAAVHLGRPIKVLEAYRSLWGRIWRVIGVFICVALLAGGTVVIAGLLVALLVFAVRSLVIPDAGRAEQMIAVIVSVGTFLIIAISAMVVWFRYALAIACCVVEDLGVIKSIRRSAALSKGSRFRIFLIYLVFVLLAAVLGGALGALAGAFGLLTSNFTVRLILVYIATFIASLLTSPLATIGLALVYYDERVRKEAFDLQLMMSSLDPVASPAAAVVPSQP